MPQLTGALDGPLAAAAPSTAIRADAGCLSGLYRAVGIGAAHDRVASLSRGVPGIAV